MRWHQQSHDKGGARLRRLASVTSAKPPFAISGDAVGHVSSDQDTICRNGSLLRWPLSLSVSLPVSGVAWLAEL